MFELCCAMLLGVELRRDWAGREAVAPEDASRILQEIREAGGERLPSSTGITSVI
jgi:hypothetical protein